MSNLQERVRLRFWPRRHCWPLAKERKQHIEMTRGEFFLLLGMGFCCCMYLFVEFGQSIWQRRIWFERLRHGWLFSWLRGKGGREGRNGELWRNSPGKKKKSQRRKIRWNFTSLLKTSDKRKVYYAGFRTLVVGTFVESMLRTVQIAYLITKFCKLF